MGDQQNPHTCLSSDQHDDNVRHPELHYFGCLRDERKDEYFRQLTQKQQRQILETEAKIQRVLKRIRQDDEGLNLIKEVKDLRGRFWPKLVAENSLFVNENAHPEAIVTDDGKHGYEMNASIIFLNPEEPQFFEEQKVPVQDLGSDQNPIWAPCPKGRFRYFHLPHNNMAWVMVSHYFRAV
jgi:hypothetical protein